MAEAFAARVKTSAAVARKAAELLRRAQVRAAPRRPCLPAGNLRAATGRALPL
jgi:hypothetical protein